MDVKRRRWLLTAALCACLSGSAWASSGAAERFADTSIEFARKKEQLKAAKDKRERYVRLVAIYESIDDGTGEYVLVNDFMILTQEAVVEEVKGYLRTPEVRQRCLEKVNKDPAWQKKLDKSGRTEEAIQKAVAEELSWLGVRKLAEYRNRHERNLPGMRRELELLRKQIAALDAEISRLKGEIGLLEMEALQLMRALGFPPGLLTALWEGAIDRLAKDAGAAVYRGGMTDAAKELVRVVVCLSLVFRQPTVTSFQCEGSSMTLGITDPNNAETAMITNVDCSFSYEARVRPTGTIRGEGKLRYEFRPGKLREDGCYLGEGVAFGSATVDGEAVKGFPARHDHVWCGVPSADGSGFSVLLMEKGQDVPEASRLREMLRGPKAYAFYELKRVALEEGGKPAGQDKAPSPAPHGKGERDEK